MNENQTRGESHGCVVCGKLHQLYVVYDANDKFIDFKVMSSDGIRVAHPDRPLVACEKHSDEQVKAAVQRAYGSSQPEEDDE